MHSRNGGIAAIFIYPNFGLTPQEISGMMPSSRIERATAR
jgi:hypothetical protein